MFVLNLFKINKYFIKCVHAFEKNYLLYSLIKQYTFLLKIIKINILNFIFYIEFILMEFLTKKETINYLVIIYVLF